MTTHAPSAKLGACEPCRNGDHGSCVSASSDLGDDCTCYDDSWEWHEAVGYERDLSR